MNYIDIAIIVIIALGALIGLWKGFFKTVISFFGWFISLIIAVLLTKIVADKLLELEWVQGLILDKSGSLYSWVSTILPADIATGQGAMGVLLKPLLEIVNSSGADVFTSMALLITNGIYTVAVCILLLIAIRIVLMIFTKIANVLTRNKAIGALNRFFGFIVGAVKGTVFVGVVMVIFSFTMEFGFMQPVKSELDKSVIGEPMSKVVFTLTDKFMKADGDLLDRLFSISGFDKNGADEGEKEEEPGKEEETEKSAVYNTQYVSFESGYGLFRGSQPLSFVPCS